jgi:hypothetical protein
MTLKQSIRPNLKQVWGWFGGLAPLIPVGGASTVSGVAYDLKTKHQTNLKQVWGWPDALFYR